jgi:hypothetical protein
MGKNNLELSYVLRSETVSIKGSTEDFIPDEIADINYKLGNYFDKVFDKAFEEVKKAYPEAICYRNGVKQ